MELEGRDELSSEAALFGLGDPRRISESTMELVAALARSRRAAVFVTRGSALDLLVSRGVDQTMLDAVQRLWGASRTSLLSGEAVYTLDPESLMLMPCVSDAQLVGLLCADLPRAAYRMPADQYRTLSGILTRTLAQAQADGEETATVLDALPTATEVERDRLRMLLERNEWNIARVSRILGVTRATVYNRLARFAIERRHVPKVLPRRRLAHT